MKPFRIGAGRRRRRASLVGRLIWLAAAWSLVVLAVSLAALTFIFYASSLSRFDSGLKDIADGLYAGSTVDGGQVTPPQLSDARDARVYSGKYWEIAEVSGGRLHALPLAFSRSLWDSELPGPPNLSRLTIGSTVRYNGKGPQGEPLRIIALTRGLPKRQAPAITSSAAVRMAKLRTSRFTGERSSAAMNTTGAWRLGRPRVRAMILSGSPWGPLPL